MAVFSRTASRQVSASRWAAIEENFCGAGMLYSRRSCVNGKFVIADRDEGTQCLGRMQDARMRGAVLRRIWRRIGQPCRLFAPAHLGMLFITLAWLASSQPSAVGQEFAAVAATSARTDEYPPPPIFLPPV